MTHRLDLLQLIEDKKSAAKTSKSNNGHKARIKTIKRVLTPDEVQARSETDSLPEKAIRFILGVFSGETPRDDFERCLKTRDGALSLDYKNLAEYISSKTGVSVSEEKLKGFTRSLRKSCLNEIKEMNTQKTVLQSIEEAISKLKGFHHQITALPNVDDSSRENAAIEVLNLVRTVVSHLLPADFGEGIKDAETEEIENAILEFAKSLPTESGLLTDVKNDLCRLIQVLQDYDPSRPDDDLEIVEVGVRVVIDLVGPTHLCSLFARLNLIVVLRDLMDAGDYVREMEKISHLAKELHQDPQAEKIRRMANREVTKEMTLPSPNRLSSYCVGNLIFRSLDAFASGQMTVDFELIESSIADVRNHDGGFEQIPWFDLSYGAIKKQLTGDSSIFCEALKKHGNKLEEILNAMTRHIDYHESILAMIRNQISSELPTK